MLVIYKCVNLFYKTSLQKLNKKKISRYIDMFFLPPNIGRHRPQKFS